MTALATVVLWLCIALGLWTTTETVDLGPCICCQPTDGSCNCWQFLYHRNPPAKLFGVFTLSGGDGVTINLTFTLFSYDPDNCVWEYHATWDCPTANAAGHPWTWIVQFRCDPTTHDLTAWWGMFAAGEITPVLKQFETQNFTPVDCIATTMPDNHDFSDSCMCAEPDTYCNNSGINFEITE